MTVNHNKLSKCVSNVLNKKCYTISVKGMKKRMLHTQLLPHSTYPVNVESMSPILFDNKLLAETVKDYITATNSLVYAEPMELFNPKTGMFCNHIDTLLEYTSVRGSDDSMASNELIFLPGTSYWRINIVSHKTPNHPHHSNLSTPSRLSHPEPLSIDEPVLMHKPMRGKKIYDMKVVESDSFVKAAWPRIVCGGDMLIAVGNAIPVDTSNSKLFINCARYNFIGDDDVVRYVLENSYD